MVMKNDGRVRNSKNSKIIKVIKCKNCKSEYDFKAIEEDIFKIGNKIFIQCMGCGEQIKLK